MPKRGDRTPRDRVSPRGDATGCTGTPSRGDGTPNDLGVSIGGPPDGDRLAPAQNDNSTTAAAGGGGMVDIATMMGGRADG